MISKENLAKIQAEPWWQEAEAQFYRDNRGTAQFFKAATRVECFRFKRHDSEFNEAPQVLGDIQGIPYYEVGTEQDRGFALRLAGLLLNPKNYWSPRGSGKKCTFEPTSGFRVWSESDFLDVVICFSCQELIYLKSGSNFCSNIHHEDDISLISGQLRAMIEEAFGAT